MDKFASGIEPKISNNGTKIVWTNTKTQKAVVCDIGAGSLRIQDLSVVGKQHKFKYLDINGNEINNIVLPNGKQRGLTKSEKLALSHYLILKRKEMEK